MRARCCWGCLLGQFGICSCLVMYGRSRALGHPWGRASAIASSPEAVPLALAKCPAHNFSSPISTLCSRSPCGSYFRALPHKRREIYFSQEVGLGEGALRGRVCAWCAAAGCKNLSVAPWHSAQANAAGSAELALSNVPLLGTALNRS